MDRIKKVSFVIPCYRSEHTLPHVVTEIREKMQELTQYTYDIFLVNDASPDNTMETIRDLCISGILTDITTRRNTGSSSEKRTPGAAGSAQRRRS